MRWVSCRTAPPAQRHPQVTRVIEIRDWTRSETIKQLSWSRVSIVLDLNPHVAMAEDSEHVPVHPVAPRMLGATHKPHVGPDIHDYRKQHGHTIGDGSDEWWGKVSTLLGHCDSIVPIPIPPFFPSLFYSSNAHQSFSPSNSFKEIILDNLRVLNSSVSDPLQARRRQCGSERDLHDVLPYTQRQGAKGHAHKLLPDSNAQPAYMRSCDLSTHLPQWISRSFSQFPLLRLLENCCTGIGPSKPCGPEASTMVMLSGSLRVVSTRRTIA